jgi:hypothetical protein
MGEDLVVLAAFLHEPKLPALPSLEVILDPHRNSRRDPREAVDHDSYERPVTEADDGIRFDGIEQLAGFLR